VVEAVVSATLLVVEDEDALRKVAARILTSAGYTVLTAANGEEALAVYGQHPEIRLVMTDVVMPKMSGGVLAKALKHLTPNLRILFVSGYADDVIVHHGVLEEGTSFLAKPFDPSTLLQRVRRLLGATSPNPT
jgi:CheY-like chemotaxis protein